MVAALRQSLWSLRSRATRGRCVPARAVSVDRPFQDLRALEVALSGRSFACTKCGKCCTGAGEVWVSDAEIVDMAGALGVDAAAFCATYCKDYRRIEGWHLLKQKPGGACIFLTDENACALHASRPVQCRTYPWWPGLLPDEAWGAERSNVCEGMDHADAPPLDVGAAMADLHTAHVHMLKRDGARDRAFAARGSPGRSK